MIEFSDNEAAKPNPALQLFAPLVGEWTTTGTHPLVPGVTFHGRASFTWLANGAFLVVQSRIDEPQIPSAISVFGTDDKTGEYIMMYFDERGVSRRFEGSAQANEWKWWRNAPGFSQRRVDTMSADGQTMVSRGELSRDDTHWEPDLELTYTRVSTTRPRATR